jgi:hypothetical protein
MDTKDTKDALGAINAKDKTYILMTGKYMSYPFCIKNDYFSVTLPFLIVSRGT